MNPDLERLQPYPFQKLGALLQGAVPPAALRAINVSIGEPKHATPEFIKRALTENLDGLASYPATIGTEPLRVSIAQWLQRRYSLPHIDPAKEVLPVNGSREALFAFAQTVVDPSRPGALVVMPNPFYQIYEGAALLAGATPEFLNADASTGFRVDFSQLPEAAWARVQLIYVCSPANPTGSVMTLEDWRRLFELSDRHGFVIASDECYSEIYFDESHPPLGGLEAAHRLGRKGFPRLVAFGSLSKRSNVPGMRSGYVAGDAAVLAKFLLYRTYHGGAMSPPVQAASIAAWNDEAHVVENRTLYRDKFAKVTARLRETTPVAMPEAAFYLWLPTPVPDTEFARALYADYNVTVLPGSYLAREARGVNPGRNFVRVALVPSLADCLEAAERMQACLARQHSDNQTLKAHS
ncbi:MAG TPA: succinyldiaminopimelate transaminase [Burkholderiales bacterium]|nr:succinyldiaminopimelate transaminase [Burkholderiales bacterium]